MNNWINKIYNINENSVKSKIYILRILDSV